MTPITHRTRKRPGRGDARAVVANVSRDLGSRAFNMPLTKAQRRADRLMDQINVALAERYVGRPQVTCPDCEGWGLRWVTFGGTPKRRPCGRCGERGRLDVVEVTS